MAVLADSYRSRDVTCLMSHNDLSFNLLKVDSTRISLPHVTRMRHNSLSVGNCRQYFRRFGKFSLMIQNIFWGTVLNVCNYISLGALS